MRVTLTIDAEFEDGRVDSNAQATELLADYVRQIGQHTVAKKVEGTVKCDGRPCGTAKYDGKLYSMPEVEATYHGEEKDKDGS